MSRQKAQVEFKNYVKGLITEASPLNFPDNASLDEDNFVLNRTGSRQRRLGMDYETGYHKVVSTNGYLSGDQDINTSFTWKNVAGIASLIITVIQTGNSLLFFDASGLGSLSSNLIQEFIAVSPLGVRYSYASVDGRLVVATGEKEVVVFEYVNGIIAKSSLILYIRDHFGLEDVDPVTGYDLTDSSNIAYRPSVLTLNHVYNLRNQTWGLQRMSYDNLADPISAWRTKGDKTNFPSNADTVTRALITNPEADHPLVKQFYPNILISDAAGITPAPKGYFIIDALSRGTSRAQEAAKNLARNSVLAPYEGVTPVFNLDRTPKGASVVGQFAGRVFYSGFSSSVEGGDNKSPKMGSFVLFSKLVGAASDLNKCYQEGDPTTDDSSDILDTDGGFIRIAGAYGICGLVDVGTALVVVAANGVWTIKGTKDSGFSATAYAVDKVCDHGCSAPQSIVVIDNTIAYWGDDAIYSIAPNQFGDLRPTNITSNTIQSFYNAIDPEAKRQCQGHFDSYERKARWIYNSSLNGQFETKELIFDVLLEAFYTHTIKSLNDNLPRVVGIVEVPPFQIITNQEDVTVLNVPVSANSNPVVVTSGTPQVGTKELIYTVVTSNYPLTITFASYKESKFRDWYSEDGVGIDAQAYLLGGFMTGGDSSKDKQAPFLTMHFYRTETGFETDISGQLVPRNQSSCLMHSQWGWSNTIKSNRWGREFQAYRYPKYYIPASPADPFDTGFELITSKNMLRGMGESLALYMKTEPLKDCQPVGWSITFMVNSDD